MNSTNTKKIAPQQEREAKNLMNTVEKTFNYPNLNTRFENVSTNEIINFFAGVGQSFQERFLPVNLDKQVVTGKASATACRMTMTGLETLVNNRGTLQRFEGVNDKEDTTPVKAVGFAIQHRYQSIGIDLDSIVFDGHGGTRLPDELSIWIEKHYQGALLVRGNRKRMAMIFKTSPELSQHLRNLNRHGINYTLIAGINQRVELKFGNENNTVWGQHPSGNEYQQILPEVVAELTVSDFEELTHILEEVSVGKEKRYKGNLSGNRVHLCDAGELTSNIENDILAYEKISARFDLNVDFSLSVLDLLSSQSKNILAGKGYFDGSNFVEVEDMETPIAEGGRYHTWFNVGSDVHLILGFLDKCNIEYGEDEIDSIIDRMLELTEVINSGKSKFTEKEALDAFKATEDYPSCNESYLYKLAATIRYKLQLKLQTAIEAKREQIAEIKKSEIVDPVANEFSDEDFRVEKFDPDKSLEDNGFDFAAVVEESLEESNSSANDEQLESISQKIDENLAKSKAKEDEHMEIIKRVYRDSNRIFTPRTSYLRGIGRELIGSSYSIASQTIATFASFGKYVETENKEYAPYKPASARTSYDTVFIPFAVNVGDSGIGKTQLYDGVSKVATNVMGMLGGVGDDDKSRFINQFADPKRESKFRKVDFDPATGQPVDPVLQKVRSIVAYGQKQDIDDYLQNADQYLVNDITSAGLRRLVGVQHSRNQIRKATDCLHFNESYEHPLTLYSDELVKTFNTIYDPKSTFLTGADIMERKGAKSMNVLRGETTYNYSRVGVAIAGNLTTKNFKRFLAKEIKEGTDGILPRFHFSPLFEKSREELEAISDWDVDNRKRAQIDIAGMALCIRYASIHSDNLKNCPWHQNRKLYFGADAQKQYDLHAQEIAEMKNRLCDRYSEYSEWIKSLFGKADSELSIWSSGFNVWEQAENMWFAIKNDLDIDEISTLLRSRDIEDVERAVAIINTQLALILPNHKFTLEISEEQVIRAREMMLHHYAFIELSLYELSTKQHDLSERVKQLQQEGILAKHSPEEYLLSKTTESVIKALPQFCGDENGFTVSEISRRQNFLKTKKNPKLVEKILDSLLSVGHLNRIESGNKIKYVVVTSKSKILENASKIKSQLCEFVI